jgi:hypothetical protein
VGVTPAYIKSFKDAGYNNIDADDLVALKAQNVTPALVKEYKSLGLEKGYEHIVQYSRNSKYCNVGNRSKNGYQVRTLKQFYKEQKVIKALINDEAKASKRG